MQIIYERCAGIDIHKKMVVVCVITANVASQRGKEIRSFRTTTAGLLELRDWLQQVGCTHVAMESTGVYWRPVWNLLEGACELLLVNAQHIKAVPGRKTDVRDAEWIADLLQHGLLTGSFIPPTEQRELRDLTRYRASLVEDRARVVNRRPVSDLTTQFLSWCCAQLESQGKTAWLLIWDNASWHYSKKVRTWIREHNQQVKLASKGVRILPLFLPKQSPWLNPIEPKWVHGRRAVVEPNGLLTAKQLAERICAYYHCAYEAHLSLPERVS
jgi:hypothetical protein